MSFSILPCIVVVAAWKHENVEKVCFLYLNIPFILSDIHENSSETPQSQHWGCLPFYYIKTLWQTIKWQKLLQILQEKPNIIKYMDIINISFTLHSTLFDFLYLKMQLIQFPAWVKHFVTFICFLLITWGASISDNVFFKFIVRKIQILMEKLQRKKH